MKVHGFSVTLIKGSSIYIRSAHTVNLIAPLHLLTPSHRNELPTWQVVKGLMLQSSCGTSWMDTCRLNVFPLNSIILGSSSSRPPLLRSPTATS